MAVVVLLAGLTLGDANGEALAAADRSVPAAERMLRVGPLYVTGADDMGITAILEHLGFRQGDEIPYRGLREAERRLAGLGLFVVDPILDVRPRIVPLPDGAFTRLRISVQKK